MFLEMEKIDVKILLAALEEVGPAWDTAKFHPATRIVQNTRVYFAIDGEGTVSSGDRIYSLTRGKLLLIPPFAEVKVKCTSRLKKYWMHLDVCLPNLNVDIFFLNGRCLEKDCSAEMDKYIWLFDPIARNCMWMNRKISPMEIYEAEASARLLLLPFLREIQTGNEYDRHSSGIADVIIFIEKNIGRHISLKELGDVAQIHPNYLSSIFHEKMGMPLFNYINCRRMFYALSYLRQTDKNFGEIADAVGIVDVQSFSKLFKKVYSCSPREMKRCLSWTLESVHTIESTTMKNKINPAKIASRLS